MSSEERNDMPPATANATGMPAVVSPVRALVVDDEPLVLWTTVKRLERLGWQVAGAESGHEAETLWTRNDFDIVIMDYRLSDGLGTDVVAAMRQAGHREPVVCLTAESERIEPAARQQLDIADVLSKPLTMDDLTKTVSEALRGAAKRGGESSEAAAEHVDGFRLAICPESATADELALLADRHAADDWLALDMSGTVSLSREALSVLAGMARARMPRQGRLCLVGLSGEELARLRGEGWTRDIACVADRAGLAAERRRPISVPERESLLASVVDGSEP